MNLRWLYGNFADPEFNLTRRQQHEVTRIAHKRHLKARTLVLTTAALVIGSYLMVGFGWDPLAGVLARTGIQPARWISLVSICVVAVLVSAWMYRYIYVKPVRLAMRDLGFDVCINCGYRLQGLNDSIAKCPECGATRPPLPPRNSDSPGLR
jgi:hypothetical protein